VLTHIHPCIVSLPPGSSWSDEIRHCVRVSTRPPGAQSPFAPLRVLPACGKVILRLSGSTTLPSSLLRAHALDHTPPADFGFRLIPQVFAGCCQSLLGDGPSRREHCESFLGCSDLYRGGLVRCTCSFLPSPHRPSPRNVNGSATTQSSAQRLPSGGFLAAVVIPNVLASTFACHPGRSYRCSRWFSTCRAAVACTSEQNTCRYLHVHRIC
jgi:hypothetical protein